MEDRLSEFQAAYNVLFSEPLTQGKKIFIGAKENIVCRFCRKTSPNVHFKNVAHAIPEAVGNKRVILKEECDDCNSYFSENLEDCFDKYTKPYRLMFGLKGKSKVPSYKTRDKTARVDVDRSLNQIKLSGDEGQLLHKVDNNSFEMFFTREPYVPLNIYKTLLKMAISIVDSKYLNSLEEHIEWISNPLFKPSFNPNFQIVERFTLGPSFNAEGFALLAVRREGVSEFVPYMTFFLSFGNLCFQIAIPKASEVISSMILFPIPSEDSNHTEKCIRSILNMTSESIVKETKISFGLGGAFQYD